MSGQLEQDVISLSDPLASDAVKEVMDLCVSCKACRRECPTGVDMAKMKIEFLQRYKKRVGHSARDLLVAYLPRYAPIISALPGLPALLNLRNQVPFIAKLQQWLTGISAARSLPVWSAKTLWKNQAILQEKYTHSPDALLQGDGKGVVLFADTFNAYFENENLQAAIRLLEIAGYRIHIPQPTKATRTEQPGCGKQFCCGRTYLAAGMVNEAKEQLGALLAHLHPYAKRGIAILGLEPSCLFTFKDEALVMGLGEQAITVSQQAQLLETFLVAELKAGRCQFDLKAASKPVLVHGHCHQKAFAAVTPTLELLKQIPHANPQLIESSCCGMAGSFGYEVEHITVSKQMAELSLLPAIRKVPNAWVVADGTSCRHQIQDGVQREAVHIARIMVAHL